MGRETLLDRAHEMRRNPTPAERVLWRALRTWQLDGLKFRRQVPLGPFIADFYCASARLVIEVDGATHAEPRTDAARDAFLQSQCIRVLRVWNNDVMGNLDGVLSAIREAVGLPLPPAPSRKGRGR